MAGGSHVHKTPKEAQYTHGMSGPGTGHSWFFFYPSLGEGQLQGQASQRPWDAANLTLRVGIPVLRTAWRD